MIRNRTLYPCVLNHKSTSTGRSKSVTSSNNRFKIFIVAAFAPLCLLMFVPSTFARTKTRQARSNSESRTRRTADKRRETLSEKKRSNVRIAAKQEKRRTREIVNRREIVNKRAITDKRGSVGKREIARARERTVGTYSAPNVRRTVMISTPEANSRTPARPALVNDIVIISEAPALTRPATSTLNNGESNNMPSIWPVAGAIRGGFGMRRNPFGGYSTEFHKGQDISAPYGSPVIATADGVVVIAGRLRGYGQVVYVDHGNGISTRYGHLSRIDVAPGQIIKRGDNLGLVGSTGRSTGPHLHYEVRLDGQATNPIPYLPNASVQTAPTVPTLH